MAPAGASAAVLPGQNTGGWKSFWDTTGCRSQVNFGRNANGSAYMFTRSLNGCATQASIWSPLGIISQGSGALVGGNVGNNAGFVISVNGRSFSFYDVKTGLV